MCNMGMDTDGELMQTVNFDSSLPHVPDTTHGVHFLNSQDEETWQSSTAGSGVRDDVRVGLTWGLGLLDYHTRQLPTQGSLKLVIENKVEGCAEAGLWVTGHHAELMALVRHRVQWNHLEYSKELPSKNPTGCFYCPGMERMRQVSPGQGCPLSGREKRTHL